MCVESPDVKRLFMAEDISRDFKRGHSIMKNWAKNLPLISNSLHLILSVNSDIVFGIKTKVKYCAY